jgi:hypothetical protein
MKRILSVLAIVGLAILYACGGGGDDPKAVLGEFLDAMDGYMDGMAKAESADDVVKAIEKSIGKMKALAPKMKALAEKYPELKMKPGNKLPPEFKEFEERMTEMGTKMMGAMGKAMKYMKDPKVVEALKKFEEVIK